MSRLSLLPFFVVPIAIQAALPACSSSSSNGTSPPPCAGAQCQADGGNNLPPPDTDAGDDSGPPIGGATWMYLLQTPNYERAFAAEPTPDGGGLVIITSSPYSDDYKHQALVRVGRDGKSRWTTPYLCDDGKSRTQRAFPGPKGEIDLVIKCGSYVTIGSGNPGFVAPWTIYRLRDTDGSLISTTKIDADDNADGTLIAQGDKLYFTFDLTAASKVGGTQRAPGGMVAVFSRDSGQFVSGAAASGWTPYALDIAPDGSIWSVGRFTGTIQLGTKSATAQGTDDGVIAHLAADGSVSVLRALGGAANPDYDSVYKVTVGDDGNIYVLGSVNKGESVGGDPLDDGAADTEFFASFDASGAHRWSKAAHRPIVGGTATSDELSEDVTYLHGKHEIVMDVHVSPSDANPDGGENWVVYDESGAKQRERTVATGQLLGVNSSLRSYGGRVYFAGSIGATKNTLFGVPVSSPDEDAYAVSQEP